MRGSMRSVRCVIVERIAIIAAVDVMGDPGPPADAVVGVVVGEEVVAVVEVGLEVVACPGGEDFESRAVEPAAQRAAAHDLRRPAVGTGCLGDAFVADRDIKIVVDAELESRRRCGR